MRSTFSTLFYLKKIEPKKNGNVIIMARITGNGSYVQFSSKIDIHPDCWDNKNGKAIGKSMEAIKVNRALDTMRAKIAQHYTHFMEVDG